MSHRKLFEKLILGVGEALIDEMNCAEYTQDNGVVSVRVARSGVGLKSAPEVADILGGLIRHVDAETCAHEETHRGGSIWTICDQCGMEWADDRGGFKPHKDAPEVAAARNLLDILLQGRSPDA